MQKSIKIYNHAINAKVSRSMPFAHFSWSVLSMAIPAARSLKIVLLLFVSTRLYRLYFTQLKFYFKRRDIKIG
jgi:hypothetical protein